MGSVSACWRPDGFEGIIYYHKTERESLHFTSLHFTSPFPAEPSRPSTQDLTCPNPSSRGPPPGTRPSQKAASDLSPPNLHRPDPTPAAAARLSIALATCLHFIRGRPHRNRSPPLVRLVCSPLHFAPGEWILLFLCNPSGRSEIWRPNVTLPPRAASGLVSPKRVMTTWISR